MSFTSALNILHPTLPYYLALAKSVLGVSGRYDGDVQGGAVNSDENSGITAGFRAGH